jgi:hypothetical protein
MAPKKTAPELATQIQEHIANDKVMIEWRESVTVILATQTEILKGLRDDFKQHEAAEERYQLVVTNFMSDSKTDRAVIKEKGQEQDRVIDQIGKNHLDAMKIIREINNKVWLVTGAVIIYCPVIAYMAVKLFEHLAPGH